MAALSAFHLRATGSTGDTTGMDLAEVRRAWEVLVDRRYGVELRALPSAHNAMLAGSDAEGFVKAARALHGEAGLYYTLNPITSGLRGYAKKEHVIERRWLLIDVDPEKDSASLKESATDGEKEAAGKLATQVIDHLTELGWPLPVVIDSGNGFHALYRIDLPNDADSQSLLKMFLRALSERLGGDGADVDLAVHNPARISKLPGTMARKGKPTKDRPHRPVRFISVPAEAVIVTAEQIRAASAGGPSETVSNVASASAPVAPSAFTVKATSGDGGHAYALAALEREVLRVKMSRPGAAEGRNNALNRAAFSMGQLVAAGCILRQKVEADLTFAAVSCGLDKDDNCGEDGIRKTLASGLEAGIASGPRQIPERDAKGHKAATASAAAAEPPGEWEFTLDGQRVISGDPSELARDDDTPGEVSKRRSCFEMFTLPALLSAEFPEPNWVVPGLLSEGLNILAGKPKLGKSMLALNLAMTIAGGGTALKSIKTIPGDVLYLALEDKNRRLQGRALKMIKGVDCEASRRLTLVTRWPTQEQGGLKMLRLWLDKAERPTLVIIDVWTKFRPSIREGGSQYEQDYRHMSAVKEYLDGRSCNSLLLHHCRKAAAEDALEEVSGTMGLTGVADGILVLARSRSDNDAKVLVTGRDVQESQLALRFDPETFTWESLGNAGAREESKVKAAILDAYRHSPSSSFFPSEMATLLRMDASVIKTTMWRMERQGELRKVGSKYTWPAHETPAPEREPGQDQAEF